MTATQFNLSDHPHRRYNPLSGEWVLVSPHRSKRPWQGQDEAGKPAELPRYDDGCYLCPGNTRASGAVNADYQSTFVFENDFAALLPDTLEVPDAGADGNSLFRSEPVQGESHVICYSPDHAQTLPELSHERLLEVIDTWADVLKQLGEKYPWVQVFENKGEMMGCSQPHPHGQVWANSFLPVEIANEEARLRAYQNKNGSNLLVDYAEAELQDGARTVVETECWLAVVPYWATWPFETLLLPKAQTRDLTTLDTCQREDLAVALKQLTSRYDNLFESSFPYSMGWHFAPFNLAEGDETHWQLHAHFYPPLLRSATVRKFMVGYEMLAEAQRDLTPEQAAEKLRRVSDVHYKARR